MPLGAVGGNFVEIFEGKLVGKEHESHWQSSNGHQQCRHEQLHLQHALDILVLSNFLHMSGEEAGQHA